MATKYQWFFRGTNGQEYGPYTDAELRMLVQSGRIQRDTLVRTDTSAKSVVAGRVKGLFPNPNQNEGTMMSQPPSTGDRPPEPARQRPSGGGRDKESTASQAGLPSMATGETWDSLDEILSAPSSRPPAEDQDASSSRPPEAGRSAVPSRPQEAGWSADHAATSSRPQEADRSTRSSRPQADDRAAVRSYPQPNAEASGSFPSEADDQSVVGARPQVDNQDAVWSRPRANDQGIQLTSDDPGSDWKPEDIAVLESLRPARVRATHQANQHRAIVLRVLTDPRETFSQALTPGMLSYSISTIAAAAVLYVLTWLPLIVLGSTPDSQAGQVGNIPVGPMNRIHPWGPQNVPPAVKPPNSEQPPWLMKRIIDQLLYVGP